MPHTPGPWTIDKWTDRTLIVGCGRYIASISSDVPSVEDRTGNARLIAAAPELLEALRLLCHNCTSPGFPTTPTRYPDSWAIRNARKAIAKAAEELS